MSERSYSSQEADPSAEAATQEAATQEAATQEAAAQAEALAQLASMPAGTLVAETAASLANLAAMRLAGGPEQRPDLAGARLLIDAFAGVLDGVRGRLGAPEGELRQALAQLRMAFVNAARDAGAAAGDGQPPSGQEPAGQEPAGQEPAADGGAPAGQPEPSGDAAARIARPRSGLWVPGEPL